jgi:phosphate:Na+ symporter
VATFLLQSSTLVSLLTIAFLSTGLITLAGSLAVLFGANLGPPAASGCWPWPARTWSMAPLAAPLLVFGVLLGFSGARRGHRAAVAGHRSDLLGIDEIKQGFTSFGDMDLQRYSADGLQGALLFVAVGALITVVVQSSHATLMLTLAALGSGQLELQQSLCIAIGSNVGSSVSTAVMGMIGSSRSGQRLAIAHVVFNCSTAVVSFALLSPLSWLVVQATGWFGAGSNLLIQLALFHTLFNVLGVLLFLALAAAAGGGAHRWLPDKAEPAVLIATQTEQAAEATQARYLQTSALQTTESAARAVAQELQHMGRLSLEVICHALYCPLAMLEDPPRDDAQLRARVECSVWMPTGSTSCTSRASTPSCWPSWARWTCHTRPSNSSGTTARWQPSRWWMPSRTPTACSAICTATCRSPPRVRRGASISSCATMCCWHRAMCAHWAALMRRTPNGPPSCRHWTNATRTLPTSFASAWSLASAAVPCPAWWRAR